MCWFSILSIDILRSLFLPLQSTIDLPSLQPLQQELQKLPLYSFWNLGQDASLCFHSIDDVLHSTHPEISAICGQFKQVVGNEIQEQLKEDEEIEVSGLNALIVQIHQLESSVDPFVKNIHLESNNQLSFFMELYGKLLTGLPDVTYEDFQRMDSFFNLVANQNVL